MSDHHDETVAVYVISVAAELSGMHPQTLRQYDRLGLVRPQRTGGGGRRYSPHDLVVLAEVARLSSEGLNLEGIRRVLELEAEVRSLQEQIDGLVDKLASAAEDLDKQVAQAHASYRRDLVPVDRAHVVVWRQGPD